MDIIGHRGCGGLRRENTLTAISHAMHLGVHGVEIDVHLTKDRRVVVHHDFSLNPAVTRHLGVGEIGPASFLYDMTLDDIQTYDLVGGGWFEVEKIPTLDDVLVMMASDPCQACDLYIELKMPDHIEPWDGYGQDLQKACLDLVFLHECSDRVRYLSFDFKLLIDLKKQIPDAICGFLTDDNPSPQCVYNAGGRVWCPYYKDITADNMAQAAALGLTVMVWTPNTGADMAHVGALGVEGIITDRPDVALCFYGTEKEKS